MRAAFLAVLLLAGAPVAAGASERADEVAAALANDPVYVAPARAQALPAAAAGQLRIRIARKDNGRIKIAVIPAAWVRGDGGVAPFAAAVDRRLQGRGALLVIADSQGHVITSHRHSSEAAAAVGRALDGPGGLEGGLRRSIDALTDVDPGPSGDIDNGGSSSAPTSTIPKFDFPDPKKIVDDVTGTIRWTIFLIVGSVIAFFLLAFFMGWRRSRAVRAADAEALADDRTAVDDERNALGDDIVDLDTATAMPNVPAAARAAYERALDAYEKSELALARADNRRRLEAARKLVADGRRDAKIAREAVGLGG